MKKLVSVLLALAMCLTVSIPTVASGNTAKSFNEIIYDYVEYLDREIMREYVLLFVIVNVLNMNFLSKMRAISKNI